MTAEATISARAALRLRLQLEELGLSGQGIFEEVGLGGQGFTEEQRVPRGSYLRAKALASKHLQDPCLGFWLGGRTGLEELDLLGALVGHAHTLREALTLGSQYLALWEEGTAITLEPAPEGRVYVRYETRVPSPLEALVDAQHSALLLANALRALHPAAVPRAVLRCACPRPRHARCLESAHGAGVALRFDAADWHLELPAEALEEPLAPKHSAARRVLREAAAKLHGTLVAEDDLLRRVRALLRSGRAYQWGVAEVARELGSTARTLQWRLRNEGTSFRAEQRAARREAARSLLAARELPVHLVAERLGFASAAAFTRFVREELGATPTELRGQPRR